MTAQTPPSLKQREREKERERERERAGWEERSGVEGGREEEQKWRAAIL